MKSIWSKLYDPFKDRRNGSLFLITFFAFFGVFALMMVIHQILNELNVGIADIKNILRTLLPGIFILTVALAWKAIRQTRPQPKKRFQRQELSRDEILKARSKLVKFKN